MTARSPTAASTWPTPGPTGRSCWAAPSCGTATPSQPSRRSRRPSGCTPTPRAATAPASPPCWKAPSALVGPRRHPRPSSSRPATRHSTPSRPAVLASSSCCTRWSRTSPPTPPPLVTPEGIKPFPPTGARRLNLRTLFFYGYSGITPAMCMRLTNLGSQYLVAFKDADGRYFDGARSYTVTLPADIPEARFWSLTLYDNQTRSMLQTPSGSRGPAARATPRRPPRPTPTGRPPSTWPPRSRPRSPRATGSRPSPARDGS